MKKKWNNTTVGKILIGATSLIPGVGPALAETLRGVTSPLEALQSIQASSATPEDKHRLTELLLKADAEEQRNVTRRWEADAMSDSYLSKNVRPAILILFSVSFLVGWYLEYPLDDMKALMMLILGGYFGARSVEKVMKK